MPESHRLMGLCAALLAASLCALFAQSQGPPQAGAGALPTPEQIELDAALQLIATAIGVIEPTEHNLLYRPIELSDGYTHWVDRTYAYGSTQNQRRPVHLGVEFVNPRGTPIYAAMAGVVVYAGDDSATLFGPQLDYYGKVVVLAHRLHSLAGRQVFTLYGHLEAVEVEGGQELNDLDRLGRIGSSGVALGPHLHFEVRVDDPYDYRMTRNPELWLQNYVNRGMIAGAIRDESGRLIFGKRVSVRSGENFREVFSYGSEIVNPDPVWAENFLIGDLPTGEYSLAVLNDNGTSAFADSVQVEAYRTTVVEIVLADD